MANFNGVGRPNLAVTDDVANKLVVLLITGGGTFAAPLLG